MSRLLNSFQVDHPCSLVTFPQWDLNLVLRVLTHPPFYPVDTSDPFCILAKTVFLLLLMSACHCGDIHAIDPNHVTFTPSAAILEPCPRYLPKIGCRNMAEGEARYAPIVIQSLHTVTSDPAELALCPVVALKASDNYTRHKVPLCSHFFISLRENGNPVSKATISAWVVKLLCGAYSQATELDTHLAVTSVHEIRALATSLVIQANFALFDTSKAATWATPSMFASHYLQDVSGIQGQLHVLSLYVVVGHSLA